MTAALALALSLLAAEPMKLASPGLSAVDVPEAQATFFSDHFAQQLTLRGLQVTTSSQIGTVLGFERQRQLLGCREQASSCMAELAAALGVDGVITGSVGKFDDAFQVNLSVVSSRDGHTLSAFSRKVRGSGAVLDALNDAADQVARDLAVALKRPGAAPAVAPANPALAPAPAPPRAPGGLHDLFWLPAGAGVAAGAGATALFLMAQRDAAQLEQGALNPTGSPLSLDKALFLQGEGRLYANIGYGLTAVGVVGLGVGAFFLFGTGPSQPVAVRILPGPSSVVVSGEFR